MAVLAIDPTVLVAAVSGVAAVTTAFVRRGGTRRLAENIGTPNGQGSVVAMLETALALVRQLTAAQGRMADDVATVRALAEKANRRLDLLDRAAGAGPATASGAVEATGPAK